MSNKVSIAVVAHNNVAQIAELLTSFEGVCGTTGTSAYSVISASEPESTRSSAGLRVKPAMTGGVARQKANDPFCLDCLDVYVIDNASSDNLVELVERDFPWVRVLSSPSNVGFGAGHNLVLPLLESRYHAVVNPDIVFIEDAISPLLEYLEANPEVGQITPKILNTDGSEQKLPKHRAHLRYLVARRFERFGGLAKRLSDQYTRADEDFTEPTKIEFATGSFFIINTELFRQLGGFDEDYFLYFEDCDLSCRVIKSGYDIVFYPDTEVVHHWARESSRHFKAFMIQFRSMFKFFKKNGW